MGKMDRLEILPVTLLETEKSTIDDLRRFAHSLKLEFGWHYLLDLSWILRLLNSVEGQTIIDAGAGIGIMQWYLASKGAQVISVDRESRSKLSLRFRKRFTVRGLRPEDLEPMNGLFHQIEGINSRSIKNLASSLWDSIQGKTLKAFGDERFNHSGQVIIYNQDLTDLVDIQDKSVDAIVAVSSLEHNSPENLEQVVSELQRVLKPGRPMYATLGCAKDKDWYHESSQGWCYNEQTLRRIFDLKDDIPTNFDQYDELLKALRANKELKEDLASFYFRSGDNGMPWGKWDPQYQPVGICKIKQEEEVGEG
jgi:ubiquinone/menaquinone biosynthesis C-methylase UbiE